MSSLLFEVLNAITGTGRAPATHNMPRDCRAILIHMANRAGKGRVYQFGLELLCSDADLGIVTVRRCIAELLERGWLEHRGWSGPRNNAVRCFAIRTDAAGTWPVSTAHRRESPPERRARMAREAEPTRDDDPTPPSEPPDDEPASHPVQPRPDVEPVPGPTSHVNKPPDLPPKITTRSTTQDLGPDRTGSDDLPLFGGSSGAAPSTSPEQRGRRRAAKQKREPVVRAEDRYADAYERGHRDAGFPITALTPSEKKRLGPIAATHARYRDNTPITGEALVQWFYRRARAFRREVPDPSRHRGGASPFGFGAWLDNGGDGEERPLAPGQEEEPASADDFEPHDERPVPPEWQPSDADVARAHADVRRFARPKAAAHG